MRNPPLYWQGRIRLANTEDAVLAIVAEYVASFPRDDIARMPASSRPHGLTGPDEVIAHNVQVARDELLWGGSQEVRELLRDLAIVLTEAATRLANLSLGPRSGV